MQILNIDAYASPKRELHYRGEIYPVREQDLQGFVDNLDAAERLAKAAREGQGTQGLRDQMKVSVDIVCENIPSLPRALAEGWNVEQLGKALEFIRGDLDQAAKDAAAKDADQGEKKVN